jgi:hypothetical protein
LTFVIIGILLLAWVAFLAPTLLKARNNQVRADSVGDFRHRLHALAGSGGHRRLHTRGPATAPLHGPIRTPGATMSSAQRRRRDVLLVLAGFAALTFIGVVVTRSTLVIAVQLLADAALIGYVYLLVQHKQRTQAARGVRPLSDRPAPRYSPYPTYPTYPSYGLADLDPRPRPRADRRLVPLRTSSPS